MRALRVVSREFDATRSVDVIPLLDEAYLVHGDAAGRTAARDAGVQRWLLTGASTSASAIKSLQISIFRTVSKTVIRRRRIEGSNPSPSVQAQKPLVQAVSELSDKATDRWACVQ
jgi:hypothetical protein